MHFDLAGPANNKPGYYEWDKNNFAPRVAVAWTPHADEGFFGRLTGNGKMVIRGGYSIVYDRIGTALATQLRQGRAPSALSTDALEPVRRAQRGRPVIRFQGLDVIPPTLPAAPPGGFPQTPPSYAGIITQALDGNIRDAVHPLVQRGRRPRAGPRVLVRSRVRRPSGTQSAGASRRRDAGRRRGLRSPGVDYFTAVRQLINASQGIRRHGRSVAPTAASRPIPYWENMFPDAAQDGLIGDAAHGGGVQRPRARLHHAAVQRRRVLLPGVQHARRSSRSSRRSTTRSACRARSAGRSTTRCRCPCASGSARATSST